MNPTTINPSIEQLLRVQDVDSQIILYRESFRLRPRELDGDRRKVAELKAALEAHVAQLKRLKMEADQRELDVKKCDTEIEKMTVALNGAKSNAEYTVYKDQITRQEQIRDQAADEVLSKLTTVDEVEAKRKVIAGALDAVEKTLRKKEAEVEELLQGIQAQIDKLESQRGGLLVGIDQEKLRIYERVLERHNNFAIARVENQVCHGCYMSVTSQQVNLLMQGQFLQCTCCSRVLYLP